MLLRAAAGHDKGGAGQRNRQAAGASIPWSLLVSQRACPHPASVERAGHGCATCRKRPPREGSQSCGPRARRTRARLQGRRPVGWGADAGKRGRRQSGSVIAGPGESGKDGAKMLKPFPNETLWGSLRRNRWGYPRETRQHEGANVGSGARREAPATGRAAAQVARFPPWCTGIKSAILQFSASAMTARTSTLILRLPCSMLER